MKPGTIERIEFIKQHPDYTARDLSKALDCSLHTITAICRDYDLPYKHVNRYGGYVRPGHGDFFNVFAEENWLV